MHSGKSSVLRFLTWSYSYDNDNFTEHTQCVPQGEENNRATPELSGKAFERHTHTGITDMPHFIVVTRN